MPSSTRSRGAARSKIAAPLVRCASRLACRSNSRFAIGALLDALAAFDARADARHVVENLAGLVEPVVALEDDGVRRLTGQQMGEQVERRVGDRMAVRV